MNLFVVDPEWGWWIILYFYLGGIAAGAYFMALVMDVAGRDDDRELARVGYWLAFPLIVLCGLFLTVDLGQPTRFWHMLLRSEVVDAALAAGWPFSGAGWRLMAGAPLLKYWSPMSVGSWALTVFGLCSFLSFLGSLSPHGRLAWVLRHSIFGRILAAVGCGLGLFVASYTGVLLLATNQPLWSDNTLLGGLFLTSAASTGIAAMLLLARLSGIGSPDALRRLDKADRWALVLELGFFLAFLIASGDWLVPMLRTWHGEVLVVGTLLLGLLLPLSLHLFVGVEGRRQALTLTILVLVGGLVFRYGIVTTPGELLHRGPEVVGMPPPPTEGPVGRAINGDPLHPADFSPEDGRPQGGGPGADSGNRAPDFRPRSKAFKGD
jgi:formate-dependent nitrite reductase membrane component NrfD